MRLSPDSESDPDRRPVVRELVGVYDADHTLLGEVRYWLGARTGRAHCALCDISHGWFRRKGAWDAACARLPVPLTTFHRDDAPPDVAGLGPPPVVAARTDQGTHRLLGPADLECCGGSVARFADALDRAVAAGSRWPDPAPGPTD